MFDIIVGFIRFSYGEATFNTQKLNSVTTNLCVHEKKHALKNKSFRIFNLLIDNIRKINNMYKHHCLQINLINLYKILGSNYYRIIKKQVFLCKDKFKKSDSNE